MHRLSRKSGDLLANVLASPGCLPHHYQIFIKQFIFYRTAKESLTKSSGWGSY
jgi:hypothetical protein